MSGTFELAGRRFTMASLVAGTAVDDDRQVACLIPPGEMRFGSDLVSYDMIPEAADLTDVSSGRVPILSEHCVTLDSLLGAVTAAWFDESVLCITGRLARVPDADRLLTFLTGGFAASLSLGADIVAAEQVGTLTEGGRRMRVTRWRLRELSAVVFGRNPQAEMVHFDSPVGQEMLARRSACGEAARLVAEERLALGRWRAWAYTAGSRLADELGCDANRVTALLAGEVADHSSRLLDDLAA